MKRSFLMLSSTMALLAGCSDHDPYLPSVGDKDSHGTVMSAYDLGGGCSVVEYQVDPRLQCSDDQLTRAQKLSEYQYPAYEEDQPEDADASLAAGVSLISLDCDALTDMARTSVRSGNQRIAELNYGYELQGCLPTYDSVFYDEGRETGYCSGPSLGDGARNSSAEAGGIQLANGGPLGVAGAEDEGASEFSTTNNQVADVEEADYVKNDSGHVYVLDQSGLRVFDAWPAEETRQINRLELPGHPRRLLLSGDTLVVFTRMAADASVSGAPSAQGCTYGYDCRAQSDGGTTTVLVYDVSAPESPTLSKRYDLQGGYVASRRVDDDVYVVIHRTPSDETLPGIDFTVRGNEAEELAERYEDLVADIDQTVDELPDSYFLPDSQGSSGSASCEDALTAEGADGGSLLTVLSFNLKALNEPRKTLIATKPGFVYASADALYVATDGVDGAKAPNEYYYAPAASEVSTIHKFSLTAGTPRYAASAVVRGHVLNQFSMDEQAGVLRVAATSGRSPDPEASSNITTLGETEQGFGRLGELTGLAPAEDIRSVRFDGDRGFVVTFRNTDPLYVIGLADPAQPTVLGELKIPGFSTYMHPLDQNHLLSVGYDADDGGSISGIQLQMFDVSNLAAPTLLHKQVIGTWGSVSEALMNHLAFNYFAPKKMLALPITVCGGDYAYEMTFSGIIAYDISVESGITEHGRMPFADATQTYDYWDYRGDCSSWWASSTSNVKRSIFLDDFLVGLSNSELRIGHLEGLDMPLVTLPLTDGSTEPMPLDYYY